MKVLKRFLVIVIILVLLGMGVAIFINSKPQSYYPPSAGLWKSVEPEITFYIDENSEEPFDGTYFRDGVEESILVSFRGHQPRMEIFPESAYDRPRKIRDGNQTWFNGYYDEGKDGQTFTYRLLPRWRKETGYKKIVFTKVEE